MAFLEYSNLVQFNVVFDPIVFFNKTWHEPTKVWLNICRIGYLSPCPFYPPLFGCCKAAFFYHIRRDFRVPQAGEFMARPTKMTPAVIAKLDHAFAMGCSDLEACMYADISQATLYRYQEDNVKFRERKEVLKSNPIMMARSVLIDALRDGDVNTAHKMIDRKEGSKVSMDHSTSDGSMRPSVIQLMPVKPDDNSDD